MNTTVDNIPTFSRMRNLTTGQDISLDGIIEIYTIGGDGLFMQLPGNRLAEIVDAGIKISAKADKWDALEKKIASFYVPPYDDPEEFEGGDLLDIGEAAARAFGFM